ncbi:MAG: beta-galactosidase [Planctomycetota bacterium]
MSDGKFDAHRRTFLQRLAAAATLGGIHSLPTRPSSCRAQSPSRDNDNKHPHGLPGVPIGAVYFRKSSPPKVDWPRDYEQASSDGMRAFRHWFIWSAIEISPGRYDFSDYDRHLDLAAEHGLKTIIGEYLGAAPQWAWAKYPEAIVQTPDEGPRANHYARAAAVGGWPGLCLDNEDVKKHAERFLVELTKRYRDHPGLGGYDVWNELNQLGDAGGCHCEASAEKFREWLRAKYGDLKTLGEVWYRYSYTDWSQVMPPGVVGPYPDSIDWTLFRVDNAMRLFRWRVNVIRKNDPNHLIAAHAIPRGVIERVGPGTYPVFKAARSVDVYGYSGGGAFEEATADRWQHWMNMDIIRSAAEGKPFWCGEQASGNQWNWEGKPLNRGRVSTPSDVSLYCMTHFAGGARGIFSPRWRPLQDGPFADSFAFYALDGSPTGRSRSVSEIARWANDESNEDLMAAKPITSQMGLLVVPESQILAWVREQDTDSYYHSIVGAYQGFLHHNLQVDFVPVDRIEQCNLPLYLPYPMMLTRSVVEQLKAFVRNGGKLICEGLPAFYGDLGRVSTKQPGYQLGELFGVSEQDHQLTADLLEDVRFRVGDEYDVAGGLALQSYRLNGGVSFARYQDGRIAGVDHEYGGGRTRLIGTFPGFGYYRYGNRGDESTRRFFSDAAAWAGVTPDVRVDNDRIVARLQVSQRSRYLWMVNSTRSPVHVQAELSQGHAPPSQAKAKWHRIAGEVDGMKVRVRIPAREVAVLDLGENE